MEILFLLFLVPLALATQCQQVVLDADIKVIRINARNLSAQEHAVLILVNVNWRNEAAGGQELIPLAARLRAVAVLEKAVQLALQAVKLTEGLPTRNCHDEYLLLS